MSSELHRTNLLTGYVFLLLLLKTEKRFDLAFLKEMPAELPADRVRLMVRHDVDHDLVTAVQMSRIEKAFGVPSSYYLHHASPYYYGEFGEEGAFHRYEGASELYLQLHENGAEVGLHVDGLSVFRNGVNGTQAVSTELDWLRSLGLNIRGATAHNSAPYYGAENFELFREWKILERNTIEADGKEIPLGGLSAEELGLEYEGNFATRSPRSDPERLAEYLSNPLEDDLQEHLRRYLHDNPHALWGQDYTIWLYGRDRWALAATDPQGPFHFDASTEDVFAFLREVPGGSRVVLHIHPCYYGLRSCPNGGPFDWDQSAYRMSSLLGIYAEVADTRSLLHGLKHSFDARMQGTEERLSEIESKLAQFEGTLSKARNSRLLRLLMGK